MKVEFVPDLELGADGWTRVLVWNWCHVNGLLVGPIFWNGAGALGMDDQ